tara:strand:+ start:4099 stop:8598 length:4500 start_codon:yes stop_codon:yes gene_type:complete
MENNSLYPLITDDKFNEKILSKSEFNYFKYDIPDYIHNREIMKVLSDDACNKSSGYIYKQIQLLVSQYISLNTPYNGLLLYHGVGVGKTCTSLLVADNFKEYVRKNGKKIIILTKPAIQNSFRNEIFNYDDFMNNIDKNMFKCLSQEFIDDWKTFKNTTESSKYGSFLQDSIMDSYFEIYGYQEFVNKYKSKIKNSSGKYDTYLINSIFSNIVLVIDEIHNLRDDADSKEDNVKESKDFINNIIENLKEPIKLILLSATPMYDTFEEMEFIVNLLLKNDKRNILKKNIFDLYIKSINENDITNKNIYERYILKETKGYISYMKGNNPLIFPKILYPENSIDLYTKNTNNFMTVIFNEMNSPQKEIYSFYIKNSINELSKQKYANITFPLKQEKNKIIEENLYTFNDLFSFNDKSKKYFIKSNIRSITTNFIENLDKYSCKLHSLFQNIINQKTYGKIFIYSSYVDPNMGGGKLIALLLEYLGYQRKVYNKNSLQINNYLDDSTIKRENKYYIRLDGQTPDSERNFYINEYNKVNNMLGEQVQIIIGSTNLFEGVSLLNLREIHILEPWYNKSRYEQIIGRGYRQCSHKNLPFEKRNITIYNYISIVDYNNLSKISSNEYKIINEEDTNIDVRKVELANLKQEKIQIIEDLLKINSIDCLLNKNINNIDYNNIPLQDYEDDLSIIEMIDSKENIRLIKFKENNFDCIISNKKVNNDLITENLLINPKLLQNIKYYIKTIFNKENKNYFTILEIKNLIIKYFFPDCKELEKNICSHTNDNIIKLALQDMLINKEIFYNKFNIEGYLILNGKYFMFNSLINDKMDLPYDVVQYPFKTKINNITNYHNYAISPDFSNFKPFISMKNTKTTKSTLNNSDSLNKKTIPEIFEILSQKTLSDNLDNLLQECYTSDFFLSLSKNNDMKIIYNYLWSHFVPDSGKNNPDLNNIINQNELLDIKKELIDNLIQFTGSQIFNINNLSTDLDKFTNYNENSFTNFISNLLDINYDIFFIINFHFVILNALKCVFKKHFIDQIPLSDLTTYEKNLISNYSYLILDKTPDFFIFKFIDYSKDNLNNYDYKDIQYILIEYNRDTKSWKHYHSKIPESKSSLLVKTKSIQYEIFKITIDLSQKNKLVDPEFFKEQLNIEDNDFKVIYDTFNFNNYSTYNNGYFKYCGSPINKSNKNIEPIKILEKNDVNQLDKFSNIVGHINFRQTDSDSNLSSISRIMMNLGIIFSSENEGFNVYLKGNHNSNFKSFKKIKISDNNVILHLIYCVLDQVIELNKLIMFEIILQNNNIYNDIWNKNIKNIPAKYTLDTFIDYDFVKQEFIFSDSNYENLQDYMTKSFDISLDSKLNIINNLNMNKNKLFNYHNILILLQQIYIHDSIAKNKSNIFMGASSIQKVSVYKKNINNNYTKELFVTKLFIMILYHLDKVKFYKKRWFLNLLESALVNNKLLNITAKGKSQYSKGSKFRIAESASIPSKNTYIQSKLMKNRATKYIEWDK